MVEGFTPTAEKFQTCVRGPFQNVKAFPNAQEKGETYMYKENIKQAIPLSILTRFNGLKDFKNRRKSLPSHSAGVTHLVMSYTSSAPKLLPCRNG